MAARADDQSHTAEFVARFAALRVRDQNLADRDEARLIERENARARALRAQLARSPAPDLRAQLDQASAELAEVQLRVLARAAPDQAAADRASAQKIAGAYSAQVQQDLLDGPFLAGRAFEITFPYDEATVRAPALGVLRQAAILVKELAGLRVVVTGSARTGEDAPELLARRRAMAAAYELASDDVPPESIEMSDQGTPSGTFGDVVVRLRFLDPSTASEAE